jgi:hypothetical protein
MGVSKEKCKESERLVEELRDEVYHKEEAQWLARKELRERDEHVHNIETEFNELQKLLIQLEPHGANVFPKLMPSHANVTLDVSSVTHKSESSVEIGGQRNPSFRYMPSPPRTPAQGPFISPRQEMVHTLMSKAGIDNVQYAQVLLQENNWDFEACVQAYKVKKEKEASCTPPRSPPRTANTSGQSEYSQSIATTTTKPTMEPVARPVMLDFASLPRVGRLTGPPPHLLVTDPLSAQAAPKIYR